MISGPVIDRKSSVHGRLRDLIRRARGFGRGRRTRRGNLQAQRKSRLLQHACALMGFCGAVWDLVRLEHTPRLRRRQQVASSSWWSRCGADQQLRQPQFHRWLCDVGQTMSSPSFLVSTVSPDPASSPADWIAFVAPASSALTPFTDPTFDSRSNYRMHARHARAPKEPPDRNRRYE